MTDVPAPDTATPADAQVVGSVDDDRDELPHPVIRLTGLIVALAAVWTLATLPLAITGQQWIPTDDALRHAAKAISGREWAEVLVLREDAQLDPHPGWHVVLRAVYDAGVTLPRGLVLVSVWSLAAAVLLAPLSGLARAEAWLAALLLAAVAEPTFIGRVFLGRPYLVSMAVLLVLGAGWRRLQAAEWPRAYALTLGALLAFALWTHGNPATWALPVLAFLLAGEFRVAGRLSALLAAGGVVALLLTGHPVGFLTQTVLHPLRALATETPTWMLVGEFQPSAGSPMLLAAAGLLVAVAGGPDVLRMLRSHPMAWLALVGWVFGLRTQRVWIDWGLPAALLLVTDVLHARLDLVLPRQGLRRIAVAAGLCLAVALSISADRNRRWSNPRWNSFAEVLTEGEREWLPEPGGILYNTSMSLFYQAIYRTPMLPYRCVLGFEPAMMPDDDLRIFREIQRDGASDASLRPWVAKLRAQDRIQVTRRTSPAPAFPQTEWHSPMPNVWMGRLRRPETPSR